MNMLEVSTRLGPGWHRLRRALLTWGLGLCLASAVGAQPAGPPAAEADPPGRVGRLAQMQGKVSVFEHDDGQWAAASRNRPLTSGDRISTETDARAELRVGSTVLRLDGGSELEVLRLDDERLEFQLHAGSLALRVRSRAVAAEIAIVTAEVRLRPLRSGRYRIDREEDSTFAGSALGELRIEDDDGFVVDTGRRVELWRDDRGLRHVWAATVDDAFSEWVARADRDDERSAATRHVSPEMTGVEELDRHGRWDHHPEYGAVWVPAVVLPGWAPYRHGRWAWLRPWGWTWVDDAPWGFAPFHYGRWLYWGNRWAWTPGVYVARPVYAPALVAWTGGPRLSVSVHIGGAPYPAMGWVPLAPREVYVPYYPASPRHHHHLNPPGWPVPPGRTGPPVRVPPGPVSHGNQQVPGAVTLAPRDGPPPPRPVGQGGAPALRPVPGQPARPPAARAEGGDPGAAADRPRGTRPRREGASPTMPPIPVASLAPRDIAARPAAPRDAVPRDTPPRVKQSKDIVPRSAAESPASRGRSGESRGGHRERDQPR
jgi:hypothetical protein